MKTIILTLLVFIFIVMIFVDNITIDNITEVMIEAHQTIYRCIDSERSRMNFEGVQNIRFKLIVDEPV